jgi:hypothetical protein
MSDLSHDARALIAQTRDGDEPSANDAARVRAKLEPKWVANAPADGAADGPSLGRSHASTVTWVAVSLSSAALVVGLLLARSFYAPQPSPMPALRPPHAALSAASAAAAVMGSGPQVPALAGVPASPPQAPREEPRRALRHRHVRKAQPSAAGGNEPRPNAQFDPMAIPGEQPKLVEASHQALGKDTAPRGPSAERAVDAQRDPPDPALGAATPSRIASTPGAHVGPADAPANQTGSPKQNAAAVAPHFIEDELTLLGAAQQALRNHRPELALQLAERHGFRFPVGALAQERLALEALALCALHRVDEARRRVRELALRVPGSPLLARVRDRCQL